MAPLPKSSGPSEALTSNPLPPVPIPSSASAMASHPQVSTPCPPLLMALEKANLFTKMAGNEPSQAFTLLPSDSAAQLLGTEDPEIQSARESIHSLPLRAPLPNTLDNGAEAVEATGDVSPDPVLCGCLRARLNQIHSTLTEKDFELWQRQELLALSQTVTNFVKDVKEMLNRQTGVMDNSKLSIACLRCPEMSKKR